MWSQTEDEDSDGLLTSDSHESMDDPAVPSPDASLGLLTSNRAVGAPCPSFQRELRMTPGQQEHSHKEKTNRPTVLVVNLLIWQHIIIFLDTLVH